VVGGGGERDRWLPAWLAGGCLARGRDVGCVVVDNYSVLRKSHWGHLAAEGQSGAVENRAVEQSIQKAGSVLTCSPVTMLKTYCLIF